MSCLAPPEIHSLRESCTLLSLSAPSQVHGRQAFSVHRYIQLYSCNRFVYRALRSAVSEGPTQARPHPTLRHTGSISNGTAICAISSLVFVLTIIVSYHKRAQGRSAATPGAGWGPITAQDIQHDTGGTSVHRSSEPGATEILDAGGPDVFVV